MQIFDIKYLISALIGIDVLFLILILILLKRLRYINQHVSLGKEINIFESLVKDADNTAGQFNKQLKEKQHIINKLNDTLDKRISSLKMLINRSDIVLSNHDPDMTTEKNGARKNHSRHAEIMQLDEKGYSIEEIAQKLSIQRGEVTLVLKMK
jgi:DNA-binding NarL/FixJ family response regulator